MFNKFYIFNQKIVLRYDNFLFAIQYVIPLFVLTLMYGRIIYTMRSNSFFSNPNITKAPHHYKAKKKVSFGTTGI